MKVVAALQVDLETTPLGTRSRLAEELHGETVLRRTIDRVCAIPDLSGPDLSGVVVLCPEHQYDRCVRLLAGCDVQVHRHDAPPPPWANLVRSARKWSLNAWRGGIGGTNTFDEYTDPRLLAGVLQLAPADAVLSVPAAAPLFDPVLARQMIEHRERADEDVRLTFTTAPPGVAGILLDASLVKELAEKHVPVGWLFSYQPDAPRKDLIFMDGCVEIPAELRYTSGRLIADTQRAVRTIFDLLSERIVPSAREIGVGLSRRSTETMDLLPRELEIELTTDDPYPDALLRPRGVRVPARGPIDLSLIRRCAEELAGGDDSLVVLGGFGEPLRHAGFADVLCALRAAGVYGIAVRTAGVDLSDERIETLITHRVDVLSVILDAWSPDLYGRLQSPQDPSGASLEFVRRRIDRLEEMKRERGVAYPIVVPEMTKTTHNLCELEAFYDGWMRRLGAASIVGPSNFGGTMEDHGVMDISPPQRRPCRRIRSRCLLLADGRLTTCDQDVHGANSIGDLHTQSLADLWRNSEFSRIRALHQEKRWGEINLCASCRDWHRP